MYDVFLVTNGYPYGNQETFLDDELAVAGFEFVGQVKILILSPTKTHFRRPVPTGIDVLPDGNKIGIKDLFAAFFYFIPFFSLIAKKVYFRDILKGNFRSLLKVLLYYSRLKRIFQKVGLPRIIYTYWFTEKTLAAVLLKLEAPGLTVVSRVHGYDLYHERNDGLEFPFRRELISELDSLFVLSKNARKYLVERFRDLPPIKIRNLGVPVPIKEPSYDHRKFSMIKFVTVAFPSKVKNLRKTLSVLDSFAHENPSHEIEWTYIGSDERIFGEVEGCSENFSVRETGVLTPVEIRDLYRNNYFDYFVLLSSSEGMPVSIMDAMAHGVPCIVTPVGGIPEMITNGEDGGFINLNGEDKEFMSVFTLLEKNKKRVRESAYRRAKFMFNSDVVYNSFYRDILRMANKEIHDRS